MDGPDSTADTATAELPVDASLLDKLLQNRLSEEDARQFAAGDQECIIFTLLALQQRVASAQQASDPNTPSAAVPVYGNRTPEPVAGWGCAAG